MLKRLFTILIVLTAFHAEAQYYIRGDIKNEEQQPVQNVKIYRPSTRSIYYSGFTGGFGIPSSTLYDSLVITKEGYDTLWLKLKSDEYQHITLRISTKKNKPVYQKMATVTTGVDENTSDISVYYGETYSTLIENDFIKTTSRAQTSFGVRIDKASYSNVRRFLTQNMTVPKDAVRIDEMLNYFNFNYKNPDPDKIFCVESKLTDCPWDPDHRLLFMNISAKKLDLSKVPPSNFVFLIDVSGSMDQPNRLPLLKEAFRLFVQNLRDIDTVSIVTYGGNVGVWLTPTSGAEKEKISTSIEQLYASGDTPGEAAIRTAYKLSKSTFIEGGNNRIILATDGDFNIGISSEKELETMIMEEKKSGVYLTCLGVGMGNYKDSKIEALAKKGSGNFAYIDDIHEAEKVLVMQFTQTMYAVANDVFVSVKFDSGVVAKYRLIGYDNNKSDFKNAIGEPEGGEVGSGAGNTILFELEPADINSKLSGRKIAHFAIHYKTPADTTTHWKGYDAYFNYIPMQSLDHSLKFATAVSMLGMKLKKSKHFPEVPWDAIKALASEAGNAQMDYLQHQFLELVDKCKDIYDGHKKKRKK